eukprot:1152764-Pelagomonas_calceolata.AAC.6
MRQALHLINSHPQTADCIVSTQTCIDMQVALLPMTGVQGCCISARRGRRSLPKLLMFMPTSQTT